MRRLQGSWACGTIAFPWPQEFERALFEERDARITCKAIVGVSGVLKWQGYNTQAVWEARGLLGV